MKKSNLLAIGLAGAFLLTSGVTAFADPTDPTDPAKPAEPVIVQDGENHHTDTTVTILDGGNTNGKDDFDPTKPDAKKFALIQTPKTYKFKTKVSKDDLYTLTTKGQDDKSADQSFKVFNDFSKRQWEVRAKIDRLKLNDTVSFKVESFKINGNEIAETGVGAVAKNTDTSEKNNTNVIETKVGSLELQFNDYKHVLKANNTLTATVTYELYYAGLPN